MMDLNSCRLTAAITAIANGISSGLKTEEITLIAAAFVQLGDRLATIATQRAICEEKAKTAETILQERE